MEWEVIEETVGVKINHNKYVVNFNKDDIDYTIDFGTLYYANGCDDFKEYIKAVKFKINKELDFYTLCEVHKQIRNLCNDLFMLLDVVFEPQDVKELEGRV